MQELREEVGIHCSKLLSNYLPFRPVILIKHEISIRIYVRPSIPFPEFPKPSLNLEIPSKLIAQEIKIEAIEKKLEAPWIRKTSKKTVQFT